MDYGNRDSVRKGNSAARAMGKLAAKMLSGGRPGADRFSALLDDSQYHVALWAAHHVLELGQPDEPTKQRALGIIERASRGTDANALGERIWLQEWRERPVSNP